MIQLKNMKAIYIWNLIPNTYKINGKMMTEPSKKKMKSIFTLGKLVRLSQILEF